MSDFDDRPLVAGSIYGLRSFGVDKLGRLTGVTHKTVWTPGENVASCSGHCSAPSRYGYGGVTMASILSGHYSVSLPSQTDMVTEITAKALGVKGVIEKIEVPEHRPGGIGNSCGYWAFFDGSNDYHDGDTVAAIVEGYGTVTIGTRGFRAQKAQIAALIIPSKKPERSARIRDSWRRYAMFASKHEVASVLTGSLGMVGGLIGTIGALAAGPAWIALLAFPILLLGSSLVPATLLGDNYRYEQKGREPVIDFDRIRQNYADVPVFSTVKAALKAYPVAHPEPPSAITPETHADFWTRSAS